MSLPEDKGKGEPRESTLLVDAQGARANAHASRSRLLTSEEFLNDLAPQHLVERLIYRSSTHLLTGAGKLGKSWWAYQLAMCVAAGVPFLGLESSRGRVLLLSLEMSAGIIRERMKQMDHDLDLPMPEVGAEFQVMAPTSEYFPALDIGLPMGRARMKDLIAGCGAELVILDTLYRFLPGKDPLRNDEMGEVFGALNEISQATGAAILILDHVAKGEQAGPVSHSGLGAQVKGGASRVIIGLKRTTREDGGRWEVNVESHYGSWDEPLYYERPRQEDGLPGGGCVVCEPARAFNLTLEMVHTLFLQRGQRDDQGRPAFASKRKLVEALIGARYATGNNDGAALVAAITRDFSAPETETQSDDPNPIVTSDGPRNAVIFTWRGELPGNEVAS